ncbi:MAG TPA: TetR/AcrR family transcriptional regulator [Acidobacteriaceae bacterium]|jgi:TetR/AcrR family transcriptional repressor of nem operon|nr:TetR/AcrR family transcriptional regulator [Acidobacteriaceae bacterium]
MKVSKEKMAEHREKIIASAAKRFREHGFEGIGVAELMKEAGLTHGAFYGHFASKEELVELALERAMRDSTAKLEKVIAEAQGDPWQALAEFYLSLRHRKNAVTVCIFPSLGGEIARQPTGVRSTVTDGLQGILSLLGRAIRGKTEKSRRRKAIAAFASMVGGMVLARSTEDPTLSAEILEAVSEALPDIAASAPTP